MIVFKVKRYRDRNGNRKFVDGWYLFGILPIYIRIHSPQP